MGEANSLSGKQYHQATAGEILEYLVRSLETRHSLLIRCDGEGIYAVSMGDMNSILVAKSTKLRNVCELTITRGEEEHGTE
jgi:hypothetical protein